MTSMTVHYRTGRSPPNVIVVVLTLSSYQLTLSRSHTLYSSLGKLAVHIAVQTQAYKYLFPVFSPLSLPFVFPFILSYLAGNRTPPGGPPPVLHPSALLTAPLLYLFPVFSPLSLPFVFPFILSYLAGNRTPPGGPPPVLHPSALLTAPLL